MRLLLDTHVWIWRLLDPERISATAERALCDRENTLHLSPISTWETLVLARRGRLRLEPSPHEWVLDALRRSALRAIPLSHGIALRSEAIDGLRSADPADRFIAATALEHELTIVTADADMRACAALATLW